MTERRYYSWSAAFLVMVVTALVFAIDPTEPWMPDLHYQGPVAVPFSLWLVLLGPWSFTLPVYGAGPWMKFWPFYGPLWTTYTIALLALPLVKRWWGRMFFLLMLHFWFMMGILAWFALPQG